MIEIIAAVASVISALVLILVLVKVNGLSAAAQNASAPSAVDAKELAQELGGAIENAFRQYIPQPDKLSSALSGIVDQAGKKANEGVESAGKAILAGQEKAAEKLAAQQQGTLAALETARKALEEAATKLGGSLSSHTQQLEKIDTGSRDQLKAILSQHSEGVQKSLAGSNDQLKALLAQHADSLQKSSTAIASQLDKIVTLEKDIQQVLHIQQVTDGTLKSVAASDEFKQTLTTLRQHLAASDSLIKEVTKPRTIRLVESET